MPIVIFSVGSANVFLPVDPDSNREWQARRTVANLWLIVGVVIPLCLTLLLTTWRPVHGLAAVAFLAIVAGISLAIGARHFLRAHRYGPQCTFLSPFEIELSFPSQEAERQFEAHYRHSSRDKQPPAQRDAYDTKLDAELAALD